MIQLIARGYVHTRARERRGATRRGARRGGRSYVANANNCVRTDTKQLASKQTNSTNTPCHHLPCLALPCWIFIFMDDEDPTLWHVLVKNFNTEKVCFIGLVLDTYIWCLLSYTFWIGEWASLTIFKVERLAPKAGLFPSQIVCIRVNYWIL